jgi:HK97 family phage prohead protease
MSTTAPAPARQRLGYGTLRLARAAEGGPVTFVASTERLNRYGFRLNHDHWRLSNFRANPVVLMNHRADQLPIGRAAVELDSWARELHAHVSFDTSDPEAARVERKVRGGYLGAMSAGLDFVAEDGKPIQDWWRLRADEIYSKTWYDLAELSIVTVPADPGATRAEQSFATQADQAGELNADGCARLLAAATLPTPPATRPEPAKPRLCYFPAPPWEPPIIGGR